ncbi:MAG TPA: AI-2E family transporter [Candidatus Solibacter sp.]|nr:AI-2E family transporter [Candidatus Solibacter sp.]
MARTRQEWSSLSPLIWLAGVVLFLYFARAILIPLALALTLNFLLTPLVVWLQRLHLRRVLAVAVVMLVSSAFVGGLGWIVAGQVLQVASDLPKYRENIRQKLDSLHLPPESALGRAAESVKEIDMDFSPAPAGNALNTLQPGAKSPPSQTQPAVPVQVVTPPATGLKYLSEMLKPLLQPLGTAGMVVIFTIFILIKQEDLRDRFLRLAGVAQLHAMTLALNDAAQRISRYLVLQLLVNACYGICFGIGVFLIGIPNALLWGVIAGLFRIVPYVGALGATAFPFILALAIFHGWGPPLLVVLLFAVLDLIASNVVEPWLYGAHTGISSLALLVTTVFWTMLWGWAGLVLAIPLTVCVIVLGRYVPRMSFLHVLLGDDTALSIEAQFYQRLLALDQDDARTIAYNFLKSNSLANLYDRVLIPALALAEQDRHKGAMDERRESFLFLSASEIVSELASYRPEEIVAKPRRLMARWRPNRPTALPINSHAEPAPSATRIFCLAANDQADEITSSMLAQLLERAGHGVISLPMESSLEEILRHLPPEPQDVICISALPPCAFAQAASLCQRVRLHLPEIKILAGMWGFSGELGRAEQRFVGARPDAIVSSLAQAVEQISEWSNPNGEVKDFSRSTPPVERAGF